MHNQEDINYLSEVLVEIVAYMTYGGTLIQKYIRVDYDSIGKIYSFRFPREGENQIEYTIKKIGQDSVKLMLLKRESYEVKSFDSWQAMTSTDLLDAIMEFQVDCVINK